MRWAPCFSQSTAISLPWRSWALLETWGWLSGVPLQRGKAEGDGQLTRCWHFELLALQVRVMASGKMRTYIAQAIALLQEKNLTTIQIKAMGRWGCVPGPRTHAFFPEPCPSR